MNPNAVNLDEFQFVGLIAHRRLADITGNEWDNALRRIGWREAHNAHLFMRLCQENRGAAFGLQTPDDFARALRDGRSVPSGNAMARVCGVGRFRVIYRDNQFITLTGPGGR